MDLLEKAALGGDANQVLGLRRGYIVDVEHVDVLLDGVDQFPVEEAAQSLLEVHFKVLPQRYAHNLVSVGWPVEKVQHQDFDCGECKGTVAAVDLGVRCCAVVGYCPLQGLFGEAHLRRVDLAPQPVVPRAMGLFGLRQPLADIEDLLGGDLGGNFKGLVQGSDFVLVDDRTGHRRALLKTAFC